MSQPTQLLVLDTFFNGSTRCTTQNSLSNCLVTDSPTPSHTSYGSETTIVEHLKTSQFRCSNRPSLTAIQQNSPHSNATGALEIRAFTSSVTPQSELIQLPRYVKCSTTSSASPWIVSGVFSDCMSRSMTLHSVGAKCIPKDGMTLVSSSKNTCAFSSSSKMRMMSSAYSRSTMFSLGQLDSIPALVLPSGGTAVRHRKGATAERFFFKENQSVMRFDASTLLFEFQNFRTCESIRQALQKLPYTKWRPLGMPTIPIPAQLRDR
ncbi:hypothetical protein CSKR_108025 [Clonorchis sinensis]|uniref:Uncharacterized protein n=1 Tax=Clonorchis sinensis TaxID=79923 RepID=A0A419Q644_CLOSI|nr:hypothetical protein CSKR_108025 [Clonorchis sinensis]